MTWPKVIADVVLLSLSGVMAPGPLTAVTVANGARNPYSGALVAVGHALIEIPLMIAVLLGFRSVFNSFALRHGLLVAGGVFLLVMGVQMLRQARAREIPETRLRVRTPLLAGIVLSIGNPYFVIWWATVGPGLISPALGMGSAGFPVVATVHLSCDFVWLSLLSVLAWKGSRLLGAAFQRAVYLLCGAVVLIFAGRFLGEGAGSLFSLIP